MVREAVPLVQGPGDSCPGSLPGPVRVQTLDSVEGISVTGTGRGARGGGGGAALASALFRANNPVKIQTK